MEFIVNGKPQGKARARTFYNSQIGKMQSITPEQTRSYEDLIRWSYKASGGKYLGEAPIILQITAEYRVPASWSKRNRELALAGKIYPTVKPDCDNIAKSVLDALNGVAYHDDKQVIGLALQKVYAEQSRLSVNVDAMEERI